MAAAAPLAWEHREDFLRAVLNELGNSELGPNSLNRAIVTVQRMYLTAIEGRPRKGGGPGS